ncbi:MAG: class I SAM-dependent methyltransferase [Candidatus Alcyoniella australis]|nr:class I SAM-dependent methyltransferase [Candidatus Alcyoniella australis]
MIVKQQLYRVLKRFPRQWDMLQRLAEGDSEQKNELLAEIIAQHPGAWLDIGCGTGRFVELFFPQQYLGLDTDPLRIEICRQQHRAYRFLSAAPTELFTGDELFQGVLISHVLHHLPEAEHLELLRVCRQLLDPKGVAVIFEWAPPLKDTPRFHRIFYRYFETGRQHNTPGEWAEKLGRSGFRQIETIVLRNPRFLSFMITAQGR